MDLLTTMPCKPIVTLSPAQSVVEFTNGVPSVGNLQIAVAATPCVQWPWGLLVIPQNFTPDFQDVLTHIPGTLLPNPYTGGGVPLVGTGPYDGAPLVPGDYVLNVQLSNGSIFSNTVQIVIRINP